jgi:predicted nucleic acid-binding protein
MGELTLPSFMCDSSCMVAILVDFHFGHQAAAAEYGARLGRGEIMAVAAHSLAETFAVLTRSPTPVRFSTERALSAIDRAFLTRGEIVALETSEYVAALRAAVTSGVSGGQIYDALIAACARKAHVDVLMTYNDRHFRRFEGDGLRILVPGA